MNKVALVTGGAVRVGRALSLGLAEAGYDVAVNYHSSATGARDVEQRVKALGRRAVLVPGDVSSGADVQKVAETVASQFGRLDLLVNSASNFLAGPILEVQEDEWDSVMDVNLKGPFLMARASAALLKASRGSIVNIVDLAAIQPWIGHPVHAISKAGALHLTRVLARSLAPHVRVNAVAPGIVMPPEEMGEAEIERHRKRTPLGKVGTPNDVLRTVLFLASSPYITGEMILVDGGQHLVGGG